MKSSNIAVPVIFVSILLGLSAGILVGKGLEPVKIMEGQSAQKDSSSEENRLGRPGSAHDHAIFRVVINGSEKSFLGERFQLNSAYVHLENNRSSIVHKHAEGVTWADFLKTLNTSVYENNSSELCIDIYGDESCGEGAVVINGEFNASLDREISQGDNLLIVIDTEEWREKAEEYMEEELPEDYRAQRIRGRSI